MVKLKIYKDNEWQEYIVSWIENGKKSDAKSYHSGGVDEGCKQDAVYSACSMLDEARKHGYQAEFNRDKYTINMVSKYRPDALISEARTAAQAVVAGVDPNQLEMGIQVEMEHAGTIAKLKPGVSVKDVARSIALDHLREFPDYYTRLKKVEAK